VYGENSPFTLDTDDELIFKNSNQSYLIKSLFFCELDFKNIKKEDTANPLKRRVCVSPYWIFIAVIPKDQLTQQARTLEQKMLKINIVF